jgi:hypothetical protein
MSWANLLPRFDHDHRERFDDYHENLADLHHSCADVIDLAAPELGAKTPSILEFKDPN